MIKYACIFIDFGKQMIVIEWYKCLCLFTVIGPLKQGILIANVQVNTFSLISIRLSDPVLTPGVIGYQMIK